MDTQTNEKNVSQSAKKEELKILEWRYNQFLGEKMKEEELKQEENQSYIITEMKITNNGEYMIIGDRGGRIIIFKKNEVKAKAVPKMNYFYEYSAFDRDFDVHKSTEYPEVVKAMSVFPMEHHDKLDILSASYRTIKLHRVYNSKIRLFQHESSSNSLKIPKVKTIRNEISSKCRKTIKLTNASEINSLSVNNKFPNIFISADDHKVLLWDLSNTKEAYDLVDLEKEDSYDDPERITVCKINDNNPHLFTYGTSQGNIKICDYRTSSECVKFGTDFIDEFSNITNAGFNLTKTLFSYQIMGVHDIVTNLSNENHFATRHYLSVNVWDKRNNKTPVNQFLVYEPVIPKLSYLYKKNYLMNDKFSLSVDGMGKYLLTGGYNNMFHVFDVDQRLNTQITVDDSSEKLLNTNLIRKINSKGSCFYKKEDPSYNNINFDSRILRHCYSPVENFLLVGIQNCVFTYSGNVITKETPAKKVN